MDGDLKEMLEYFKTRSEYLNKHYNDIVKNFSVNKNKKGDVITFNVILTDKLSNSIGIAHGGAIATILDSFGRFAAFHLTGKEYTVIDINIVYKAQVKLQEEHLVVLKCNKLGNKTSFIEICISKDGDECVHSSLILSRIEAKF